MSFTPFSFEQHRKFLLDTLKVKLPEADLSRGSFWQIWAAGQARGLAGLTSQLKYLDSGLLPDHAVGLDLDHHAHVYDLPRGLGTRASGRVRAVTTEPLVFSSSGDERQIPDVWNDPSQNALLHLRDMSNRRYDLVRFSQLHQPLSGLFELDILSRDTGEETNQTEETTLTFWVGDEPLEEWRDHTANPNKGRGLESEVTVLAPGCNGGRDMEPDAALSERIVRTMAEGRLKDTIDEYRNWVLMHNAQNLQETGMYVEHGELDQVENAWIYKDDLAPNRVYVLALNAPPARIGNELFNQALYNAVDSQCPVTVDVLAPLIQEEPIDVELAVRPKILSRWDWFGEKCVGSPIPSDKVIRLARNEHFDGADGLRAGMRVMIGGELRTIGHVEMDAGVDGDRIHLSEDLSRIPDEGERVYPGADISREIQEAVARLFDTLGPIHKCMLPVKGQQNVLESVIIDAVMELVDVHDVVVRNRENLMASELFSSEPYRVGLVAVLAVPGEISVSPLTEDDLYPADETP